MLTRTITRIFYQRSTFRAVTKASIFQRYQIQFRSMADYKPNSGPPEHEMVYFPKMTTSLPAMSSEFRKVLFTGLYSQVVSRQAPIYPYL